MIRRQAIRAAGKSYVPNLQLPTAGPRGACTSAGSLQCHDSRSPSPGQHVAAGDQHRGTVIHGPSPYAEAQGPQPEPSAACWGTYSLAVPRPARFQLQLEIDGDPGGDLSVFSLEARVCARETRRRRPFSFAHSYGTPLQAAEYNADSLHTTAAAARRVYPSGRDGPRQRSRGPSSRHSRPPAAGEYSSNARPARLRRRRSRLCLQGSRDVTARTWVADRVASVALVSAIFLAAVGWFGGCRIGEQPIRAPLGAFAAGTPSPGIMSDEERDVDIESDADKRAHHNALERRRRDHIKFSFTSLRDAVPSLQGEKASRAQILKKAADYIQSMRRKNTAHLQDIEDLKRQNKLLEEQST
ncbi:hypothetical protein HPB48_020034 [Haemaphysalis longicornis]|uniref:Protein max n=1 Tax=Haemaphysalis longicornis TaxID=44386 RepID=A0A9J6GKY5_HAELO|nr:hypothetical protein HPB48_020034 [Haemaphysalis longicornis]